MTNVRIRTILSFAFAALSGVAMAAGPSESDYREAGPPSCKAGRLCAIGMVQRNESERFKVYVANDDRLNGRVLRLEGVDTAAVAGVVVVLEFSGVADKVLLDAKVVGSAPKPDANRSKAVVKTANAASAITSIDLSHWKVTLPVGKSGKSGSAMEVTDLTGFTMPPYFDVRSNSITFSASVEGARTSGSSYPRSELREMDGNGDEFEWTAAKGGTLTATLAVLAVPTRTAIVNGAAPAPIPIKVPAPGRVIVGQIHGPDDELCRLYYDNGVLYFNNDKSGKAQEQLSFALKNAAGKMTSIPLGKSFSYAIKVAGNRLQVTATVNGETYQASDAIGSFWRGKKLYFKAGAYVQVGAPGGEARETGHGTGTVRFTAIKLAH